MFGFNSKSYTYDALSLGRADGDGMYSRTLRVTVAYLPIVFPKEATRLQRRLNEIIYQWRINLPHQRAKAIIRPRAIYVGAGDSPDDIDPLLSLALDQVNQALETNELRLVHSRYDPREEPELYAREVRRLHQRDWIMQHIAHDRSKSLPQLTPIGIRANPSSGLRGSDELRDLCFYLQDAVSHWSGVRRSFLETTDVIRPWIVEESRWHISKGQDFRLTFVEIRSF